MLQYITDNKSSRSVETQVKEILDAGGSWIEIDTDGLSDDRIKEIAANIMPMCLEREAFLLLRDKVELAKEINVGGVVLSQGADFPSHARASLGAAAVVGVEVSSTQQIDKLRGLDVDFVMFYPFRCSDADGMDSLGIQKVEQLCKHMESAGLELPRVASGGVTCEDIATLMDAGCNGVAMSEALADAPDIQTATKEALTLLSQYEKKEEEEVSKD